MVRITCAFAVEAKRVSSKPPTNSAKSKFRRLGRCVVFMSYLPQCFAEVGIIVRIAWCGPSLGLMTYHRRPPAVHSFSSAGLAVGSRPIYVTDFEVLVQRRGADHY